jgi:hypothetical protein
MAHFVAIGEGAGVELHFEVDLTAQTLRLQLNSSPGAVPAESLDTRQAKVKGWDPYRLTRDVWPTPSEVLTVHMPAGLRLADYRPALMLWGWMTVNEIEPPTQFPLSAGPS